MLAAGVCTAQSGDTEEIIVAKLDASIAASGALQATVVVTANGKRGVPYREASKQNDAGIGSTQLFGTFLRNRHLQSTPAVKDASSPDHAVQIRFPILQADLFLPIQPRV